MKAFAALLVGCAACMRADVANEIAAPSAATPATTARSIGTAVLRFHHRSPPRPKLPEPDLDGLRGLRAALWDDGTIVWAERCDGATRHFAGRLTPHATTKLLADLRASLVTNDPADLRELRYLHGDWNELALSGLAFECGASIHDLDPGTFESMQAVVLGPDVPERRRREHDFLLRWFRAELTLAAALPTSNRSLVDARSLSALR